MAEGYPDSDQGERGSLIPPRSERVYIPVTVSCGCTIYFGPTLDNGIDQPLRDVCTHGTLWSGKFLSRTREAYVGRVVSRLEDDRSYAVEPVPFDQIYERKYGSADHGVVR